MPVPSKDRKDQPGLTAQSGLLDRKVTPGRKARKVTPVMLGR